MMAAATWQIFAPHDASVAEALGMRNGLNFAKEMLFMNLHVETDSIHVITRLKGKQIGHAYLDSIVEDCRIMNLSFSNFNSSLVNRVANHAAHLLAKYALQSGDHVWLEEVSHCILAAIATDSVPNSIISNIIFLFLVKKKICFRLTSLIGFSQKVN